jgi:hypothetical protein
MVSVFWPKIALPKALSEKVHCHDEKSTCPAKVFGPFQKVSKFVCRILVDRTFGRTYL